jgi:hypothetical protein
LAVAAAVQLVHLRVNMAVVVVVVVVLLMVGLKLRQLAQSEPAAQVLLVTDQHVELLVMVDYLLAAAVGQLQQVQSVSSAVAAVGLQIVVVPVVLELLVTYLAMAAQMALQITALM